MKKGTLQVIGLESRDVWQWNDALFEFFCKCDEPDAGLSIRALSVPLGKCGTQQVNTHTISSPKVNDFRKWVLDKLVPMDW